MTNIEFRLMGRQRYYLKTYDEINELNEAV